MKSIKDFLPAFLLLGFVITFIIVDSEFNPAFKPVDVKVDSQNANPSEKFEPRKPQDIYDSSFSIEKYPSKVKSVNEVLKSGKGLPVDMAYNFPGWERKAYKSYWHSSASGGRYTYVPERVHYALHRIFAVYGGEDGFGELAGSLGIQEESAAFRCSPDSLGIIVMQASVKRVFTSGNQIVLVAEPTRLGLQVVSVPIGAVKPTNPGEALLVQLVTPDGYELDYTVVKYKNGS